MEIEVAVTGLTKVDINIEIKGDYLHVIPLSGTIDDISYIQHGLKQFTDPLKFYIDKSKFDVTKINAVVKNGLLTITLKPHDVATIKIDGD
jgi:HSP20 family molecular chaperone IbpA